MFDVLGFESLTSRDVTLISTVMGTLFGFFAFIWKSLVTPALKFFSAHENLVKSVETIKKEVLPNGGNSLKDTVDTLTLTCRRIENTQKVIEQRSRISLHYHERPIFETDNRGNLIWSNENFYNLIFGSIDNPEGCNWINYIQPKDRNEFMKEFESCSNTCRKLTFETWSITKKKIVFNGTPYKTGDSCQMGFIFNISLTGE